jgi:23S rRNA pseudouridine1911/1915/1917 synthase
MNPPDQSSTQRLSGSPQRDVAPLVDPGELRSWLLYEDDSIIVFNKPGWLVCHPSKKGPWSSLVGAVRESCQLDQVYLVGRLDRETSGLILLGKHKAAGRFWQKSLEQRKVRRSYWAILTGELSEETTVAGYLGKDPDSPVFVKQRVVGSTNKSKRAETSFFPLFSKNGFTLCSVVTKTGRKHQIRVHAQSMGFPLVGEKLYGLDEEYYLEFCRNGWQEEWLPVLGMKRQGLHARTFGFVDEGPDFVAPLPGDFLAFLTDRLGLESNCEDALDEKARIWTEAQFRGE